MKLSEILPDYPIKPGKCIELNMLAVSEFIIACDREIDREALKIALIKFSDDFYKDAAIMDDVNSFISTMPTWLRKVSE